MAPKLLYKKKSQLNKKKPFKKSTKIISKPAEMDHDEINGSDDLDGSLDALEFDSAYLFIIKLHICIILLQCCFILGESDHDASISEDDDGKVYDSDDLDEEVEKLKTSDPEFYKYLKECDKNLEKMSHQSNNDDNDSVDDRIEDSDYDEDDVEGIKSEKLHKPPVNLEVSTL